MSLHKMLKEKDTLRDLNSQFKCHISELNASLCALKETLTSCSHRVDSWKSNVEYHPVTVWITTQVVFHKSNSLTSWTAASQSSLSITNCQSLLKLMSIESLIPSNHLILCCPLLLLPSVFPMNILDWFPLELTGLISLHSKGLSRVFSNTTVQKYQFFRPQLSSQSNSHIHTRPLEKP